MKCKSCGNRLFKIIKRNTCADCENNGAWWNDGDYDNGEWVYDIARIRELGLERNQVLECRECLVLDDACGLGCILFLCDNCGVETGISFHS